MGRGLRLKARCRAKQKGPASCFQETGRITGDVLLSHKLYKHYHRGCSVSLPCSEWERVGPLRWDHQKSDEFEATLRLTGEVLTGGHESNLKFARLLATRFDGL